MKYVQSFDEIKKELDDFERKRESLIQQSREVIKLSKLVIYSLHRGEQEMAEEYSLQMKEKALNLPKSDYDTGIRKTAVQEYVEAECFLGFFKNDRLMTKEELGVVTEDYLLGLCDLTGELVRYAVNSVTRKEPEKALKAKEVVEEIYGEFLKLDLRNSELRKKSDAIRWNLKKLEDIALTMTTCGMRPIIP